MNLSKKNSKQFWKLLEHKDEIFKQAISDNKWIFKSLLHETDQPNSGEFPENTAEGPQDYTISDEEINLAYYILRKAKATGLDSISNEMIECLLPIKPEMIKKLFNSILLNPRIINKWHISMIFPTDKKRLGIGSR